MKSSPFSSALMFCWVEICVGETALWTHATNVAAMPAVMMTVFLYFYSHNFVMAYLVILGLCVVLIERVINSNHFCGKSNDLN